MVVLFLYFDLLFLCNSVIATAGTNSNLRIEARFLECPEIPSCRNRDTSSSSLYIDNEDSVTSGDKPGFKGSYVIERCLRKVYISLEMNNDKVYGDDEYVLIDEVEDSVTDSLTPLLNPIVLKMHRAQSQLIYPLAFQQIVNGGAYEESFQTTNNSAEACDNSLCGITEYNGESMPFSEGFCCSCKNPRKDDIPPSYYSKPISLTEPDLFFHSPSKRSISNEKAKGSKKGGSKCAPKKPTVCGEKKKSQCRKHPPNFFFENDKVLVGKSNERLRCRNKKPTPQYYSHKGQVYLKEEKFRRVRKAKADSLRMRVDQLRLKRVSGLKRNRKHLTEKLRQSCENGNDLSPSVHCLKLSDFWYSVFRFQTPIAVQEIDLQIFQKKDDVDGREYWVDLTRGQTIKIGTFYPQATDELPTISFSYSSEIDPSGEVGKEMSPIDIDSNLLLIPTPGETYPQTEGGPSEYLVVSKDDLSTDGRDCDRIGTLFEGFSRQTRRCERSEGSCLNHQPLDLWIADMEKRIQGERGQYFVENYGEVANVFLASSAEIVKRDYLALNFTTPFRSLIEVEIRADTNSLIRSSGNIQIQSITTDSSGTDQSIVEVLVVNTGLVAGHFRPWFVECDQDLPPNCVPEGPIVFIPPLHHHFFRILLGNVPAASMTCTVEIHNNDGQRIGSRAVLLKKRERCICAHHCDCSCSQEGFKCVPLMEEEYAAAGYRGRLPLRKILVDDSDPVLTVYLVAALTFFFLLLFGKIKIIIGWKYRRVKIFGIFFITDHLNPCLHFCTDKCYLQGAIYFFLNWFFFPIYFLVILWACLCSVCLCCVNLFRRRPVTPISPRTGDLDQDYTYEMEADDEKFVLETMDSLQLLPSKRTQSSHSM